MTPVLPTPHSAVWHQAHPAWGWHLKSCPPQSLQSSVTRLRGLWSVTLTYFFPYSSSFGEKLSPILRFSILPNRAVLLLLLIIYWVLASWLMQYLNRTTQWTGCVPTCICIRGCRDGVWRAVPGKCLISQGWGAAIGMRSHSSDH